MNRRRPPLRLAVVPGEEDQALGAAVLRKACGSALGAAAVQLDALAETERFARLLPFIAGYVAGFARHQALKHGVDAETEEAGAMESLRAELSAQAPHSLADAIAELRFAPRDRSVPSARAALRAVPALADAGYLAGHLESLCDTRRLVRAAFESVVSNDAAETFLTACDVAADPMQTRHPTASLRFEQGERLVLQQAFAALR